jgi:hypothetical protein
MADDDIDNLVKQMQNHVEDTFPAGVSVPTGVSDDEAIRAVQDQFRRAGYDCPVETARELVEKAK